MAGHPRALQVLAAVSFAESSFFPVIPELMLIPMVLEQRQKAWRIATVCTIASVLGGAFGYAIGFYLFQAVGQGIIDFYGLQASFAAFKVQYDHMENTHERGTDQITMQAAFTF